MREREKGIYEGMRKMEIHEQTNK